MLEKVISDLLNQYLGSFIEDIDKDQLGASIYQGSLKLENMRLKSTMFDDSPMPFALVYGQVGRINLKIPFWDMFQSPLVIDIQDVFGFVKIKKMDQWDDTKQREIFQAATQYYLDQFELFVRQKEIIEESKESESRDGSFTEKLIARIVDNIQISIKNIYFRFEDEMSSLKDQRFSIGVRLKEFGVNNADRNYQKIEMKEKPIKGVELVDYDQSLLSYKIAWIDGFSIFCDYENIDRPENGAIDLAKLRKEDQEKIRKGSEFQRLLQKEFEGPQLVNHKYLIQDFKVTLQVQLNKDIKNPKMPATLKHPMLKAKVIIGDDVIYGGNCDKVDNSKSLKFSLYQPQILRILKVIEIIGFFNEFKEGALAKFYQNRLSDEQKVNYEKMYIQWRDIEEIKTEKNRADDLRSQMKAIEDTLDYDQIIEIRQKGVNKLKSLETKQQELKELQERTNAKLQKEIGYGLMLKASDKQEIQKRIQQEHNDEKDQIMAKYLRRQLKLKQSASNLMNLVQKYQKDEQVEAPEPEQKETELQDPNKLPDDFVQVDIILQIPALNFTMDNEFNQQLLVFRLVNFNIFYKQKNKVMKATLNLEDYKIIDMWSKSQKYNLLLDAVEDETFNDDIVMDTFMTQQSAQPIEQGKTQALSIQYEANEDFVKTRFCPYHIKVRSHKSIQIVVLVPLINELQRSMNAAFDDQKLDFMFFEKYATGQVKQIRQTYQSYADSIKKGEYQHTSVSIDAIVNAPILIIPENIFNPTTSVIRLNTGLIRVYSQLVEYQQSVNYNNYTSDFRLYDKYTISLEKITLGMIFPDFSRSKRNFQILEEVNLKLEIDNCLAPLHDKFPTMRLNILLDKPIELNGDLYYLKKFFKIYDLMFIQMEQREVMCIQQKLNKKKQKKQQEAQELMVPQDTQQLDLMRQKSKMMNLESQQFEFGKGESGPHSSERIHLQFVEEESKRQKFEQAQQEKLNTKSSNMEINVRIKRLQLNIMGDKEFYQKDSENERQSDEHNDIKNYDSSYRRSSIMVAYDENKLGFKEKQERYQKQKAEQREQENQDNLNSLTFQLTGLQVFCKFENNWNDMSIDVCVYQVEIKERETYKDVHNENFEKLKLFKKIMSSPLDDLVSSKSRPFRIDDADVINMESTRFKQLYTDDDSNEFDWDKTKDEQQLYVQVLIRYSEYFDDEYDESVANSDMEINILINRTRFIVNMPTVANLINVYNELIRCYSRMAYTYNERVLETKINVIRALSQRSNSYHKQGLRNQEMTKLMVKIFENLAQRQGFETDESKEKFLAECVKFLQEEMESFIWQSRLDKVDIKTEMNNNAIQRSTVVGKKSEALDSDSPTNKNSSLKHASTMIEQKSPIFKVESSPNTKKERAYDPVGPRFNATINKSYLESSPEPRVEEDPEMEDDDLYIHKESFFKSKMIVTLKLKNIELWVMDFKGEPQEKAQILQLKFMSDIVYDTDYFGKYLHCSKTPPLQQSKVKLFKIQSSEIPQSAIIADEEEPEESFIVETRNLRYDSYTLVNLNHLSIDQLIVQRWINVQQVVVEMQNQTQQRNGIIDYEDAGMDSEENSNSHSQDEVIIEDVQHATSKILSPTCFTLVMSVPQAEYKKIRVYDMSIECEPLFLNLDYKDIDMLYYLYIRYNQCIYPALEKMWEPMDFLPEQKETKIEQSSQQPNENLISKSFKEVIFEENEEQEEEEKEGSSNNFLLDQEECFDDPNNYEDINYISQLAIGCKTTKNEQEQFETDLYNMDIKIGSIILSLTDGEIEHFIGRTQTTPSPQIELVFNNLIMSAKTVTIKNQNCGKSIYMGMPIQHYYESLLNGKTYNPPFYKMDIKLGLYGTYFNQMSQALEPFIEPWTLKVANVQKCEKSIPEYKIMSNDFLDINLTYGMAVTIREIKARILEKTLLMEETMKKNEEKKQKLAESNLQFSQNQDLEMGLERQSTMQPAGKIGKKKPGYQFFNYTGGTLKFCISNLEVDENMNLIEHHSNCPSNPLQRKSVITKIKSSFEENQITTIHGHRYNSDIQPVSKDHDYFNSQLLELKRHNKNVQENNVVNDFIEDEPLAIDLKINGIDRICKIPLDIVGVYSYQTMGQCNVGAEHHDHEKQKPVHYHNVGQTVMRPIGLIVNINTSKGQKNIAIESQLLIANNLEYPLTLVFQLYEINQNSTKQLKQRSIQPGQLRVNFQGLNNQISCESVDLDEIDDDSKEEEVHILIAPRDVFRVPLMWLMPDSHIDLYLVKKDKLTMQDDLRMPKVCLFKNISKIFCKTAKDQERLNFTDDLESKIVELNDDFYTSVDIQGYNCFPRNRAHLNPLQYVVSLNPPLMFTNYIMNPLEIFEFEPDVKDYVSKFKIAPQMSSMINSLDLSDKNIFSIKMQVTDTVMNKTLTSIIEKFNIPKNKKENEVSKQNDSQIQAYEFLRDEVPCNFHVETVRKIFSTLKSYNQNFDFRERLIDIGIAVKMMIYPKYMLVNKTAFDIIYFNDQTIKSKTNDFLMSNLEQNKIKFKVDEYQESDFIDITTIGLSGIIKINHTVNNFKQLQFGVSIMQSNYPFAKTVIITIVPRYLVINKLTYPVKVRQISHGKYGTDDIINCQENDFQKEFHFQRLERKVKDQTNSIQFKADQGNMFETEEELDQAQPILQSKPKVNWCQPFSVDEVQDFMTEHNLPENQIIPNEWYILNEKIFTRVIVTLNPQDNNSTLMIIFDEPTVKEYLIVNNTDTPIEFRKYDIKSDKQLSEYAKIEENKDATFVWDHRDKPIKSVQIKIADKMSTIYIDKCSELDNQHHPKENIIFEINGYHFTSTVEFTHEGTKLISINQKTKQRITNRISKHLENSIGQQFQRFNTSTNRQSSIHSAKYSVNEPDAQGMNTNLKLKGIGISFIDNQPKELLYVSINDLAVTYNYSTTKQVDKMEVTKTVIDVSLGNFQIDNMINDQMPVVIGSKNYYDKGLIRQRSKNQNLSQFIKTVKDSDMESKKKKKVPKPPRVPFFIFQVLMSNKSYEDRIGQIIRYDKIRFGIQEFFIQVESNIVNDNLKFVMETLAIFSVQQDEDLITKPEEYNKSLAMFRRELCPMIDASKGVVFDEKQISADKVSFGYLQITTIKTSLTFKLEKRVFDFDFSNPRAMFGLFNILYPFISNFASITNSGLKFNELIIVEGYYSQEELIKSFIDHYWKQGTRQMFKILGNSDMIGNPAGLIDKVGIGFYELARDPLMGIQEGPEEFIQGIGTGVQGVVRGVVGGSFQSIAQMAGTLYLVIKQSTGGKDLRGVKSDNVMQGIYQGVKGMGQEVVYGLAGCATKPIQGAQDAKCIGFTKGCGQSVAGVMVIPAVGSLRAVESISQGISGTANEFSNYGKTKLELLNTQQVRNRTPRRIDVRGQIRIYDEDIAIINKLLCKQIFANQQVRFYALLPTIDQHGIEFNFKKSLLVITNDFIIYLKIYNFFDLQREKYIQKSLLMSEWLSNIDKYNIKQMPGQVLQVPDPLIKGEMVSEYIHPLFFLDIVFNKTWKLERIKAIKKVIKAPKSLKNMAPMPVVVEVEEEKDDFQYPEIERVNSKSNNDIDVSKSYSFDRSKILLNNEDQLSETHIDQSDQNIKYRYVFYSPSLEVLMRVHRILQSEYHK